MTDGGTNRMHASIADALEERLRRGDFVALGNQPGGRGEVGGLVGSAAALWVTAMTRVTDRVLLVLTPSTEEAEDLSRDLGFFLGDSEGQSVGLFPAWGHISTGSLGAGGLDHRVLTRRFSVLERFHEDPQGELASVPCRVVVLPVQALLEDVPSRETFRERLLTVVCGDDLDREELARTLSHQELERVAMVEAPGEFSMRGEIVDVFPLGQDVPLRIELFGDTVESLRTFDPATQRSIETRNQVTVSTIRRTEMFTGGVDRSRILPYLLDGGTEPWVVFLDPAAISGRVDRLEATDDPPDSSSRFREEELRIREALPALSVHRLPIASGKNAVNFHTREVQPAESKEVQAVVERLTEWAEGSTTVEVLCQNEAVQHRFDSLLPDDEEFRGRIRVEVGEVSHSFVFPELGSVLVTHSELFGGKMRRPARRQTWHRRRQFRAVDDFVELSQGDLVVHLVHGIAKYSGLETIEKNGSPSEFHRLTFKDGVALLVPVSKTDLIQKYVGVKGHRPQLSRLGGKAFAKRKQKVAEAAADFAADLLEVQALRNARRGTALPPDSVWQHEFEAAFPFEETPDQLESAARIKENQESRQPMDRLICGDVGYGKTELAMRAAFKVVEAGAQVAVLVPTTVLAQQHFDTFTQRMADFPVRIDVLSRFRTGKEQREILERTAEGKVDILIGTHRIVSPDVEFANLGLVVVDEEQRFGVMHKQRFKELKATVDVLTLSATPIPRTLHMALVGLRDISTLASPPRGRQAVHTKIVPYEPELIRDAIRRELDRDGQVYFLHNRVKSIEKTATQLASLVPEARFTIAHGQMNEHDLEDRMLDFIEGKSDVLVCTTIIESGLDIPNVNTIFIDDADRFGLAELHQLRGRVGRYNRQAYAYLLIKKDKVYTDIASRRLRAIQEYNDLGAGFRIAMRDLEIRGAGNILGAEQHGQIAAVGYDLYCKILSRAVERIKAGEEPLPGRARDSRRSSSTEGDGRGIPERVKSRAVEEVKQELLKDETSDDVDMDLPGSKHIPDDYIPDMRGKMEAYRKLSLARSRNEVEEILKELRDRYGPPPPEIDELVAQSRIREVCRGTGILRLAYPSPGLLVIKIRERAEALASLPRPSAAKRMVAVDGITVHVELGATIPTPSVVADLLEDLLGLAVPQEPKTPERAGAPREDSRGTGDTLARDEPPTGPKSGSGRRRRGPGARKKHPGKPSRLGRS